MSGLYIKPCRQASSGNQQVPIPSAPPSSHQEQVPPLDPSAGSSGICFHVSKSCRRGITGMINVRQCRIPSCCAFWWFLAFLGFLSRYAPNSVISHFAVIIVVSIIVTVANSVDCCAWQANDDKLLWSHFHFLLRSLIKILIFPIFCVYFTSQPSYTGVFKRGLSKMG